MTGKATRRSPRGESRRAAIIDAATREFAFHGYQGASLAAIADRVGITQSGLLHHFPSKEALLDAVMQGRIAEDSAILSRLELGEASPFAGYDAMVASTMTDPTWVQFLMVITADALTEDHPAHELIHARYERIRARISDRITSHEGSRYELPGHLHPDDVASLLLAVLDGLQLQWLYDDSVDMRRRVQLFLDLITNATEPPQRA